MSATISLPAAGGELSSFDPLDANTIEDTQAGTFDPAYARCGIKMTGNVTGATSPKWTAAPTFTLRWTHYINNTSYIDQYSPSYPMRFMCAGAEVMRVYANKVDTGTVNLTFYTLQIGTGLTAVGNFNLSIQTLQVININIVAGGSGSIKVYVAGTLRISATGLNHSGWAGVDQIYPGGVGFAFVGNAIWHSEMIWDTVDHIGDRLKTYPIDTLSATNTGWTGGVANVDKIVTDDSTFVSAASANLISTYYASGFSLGTYNIVGVTVAARAKCDATGPQNIQLALRTSSTNYTSSTIALSAGYTAVINTWTQNPNTSAAWLASAAQGVEGGQKSIA